MNKFAKSFSRTLLGAVAGVGLWAASTAGFAQTSVICAPSGGYVVGYYNGTFATPEDADAARAALRIVRHGKNTTGTAETIDVDGKSETARYESFYSTAGKASGATESRLQAMATEYMTNVLSGAMSNYAEYFWDMLTGSTANWSVLADKSGDSRFTSVTSSFPATVAARAAAAEAALSTELTSSTTIGNAQFARAQAIYTERQKLLMVGQKGQGALFASKAFEKVGSPTDSTVLKETAQTLPNVALKSTLTDRMAALVIPSPDDNQGFLTATLSWSVPQSVQGAGFVNDFDLHVVEPTKKHVFYGETYLNKSGDVSGVARQGDAGMLDQDSATTGPEHYYASCDENVLKEGIYEITATQQSAAAPTQTAVTLQVAFAKSGVVFSKTWSNAEKGKFAASETCPDCTGDLTEYIQVSKLVPQVKVKVTKISTGVWSAEVVN